MQIPGAFEQRRSQDRRLLVLRLAVMAVFGALAVSFWLLQVLQHARYAEMAANNHLRTIQLRAPRGVVLDRDGRVLVENRISFTIALVREQSVDVEETLRLLARVAGVDEARLRDIVTRHRREPSFRPVPLIEHATFAQVAAVITRRLEMPELVVQEVPARSYPAGGLAAHLFGYVSEIRESQIGRPEFGGLRPGAIVGQTGLERAYNSLLMGEDGARLVVVNSVGREIEEYGQQPPVHGGRLQLTIDYDLQRALEEAYHRSGLTGAAVFLDPATGEVLAMTSLPAYDPNDFALGMDAEELARLNADPLRPFRHRLLQDRYSPGSTFKIAMAVAALASGTIKPAHREYCAGSVTLLGRTWRCNRPGGHGWVDVRHALEQSCNVFFYRLGERMSIDTIHQYAERLGLVGLTGIELPGERESLVPSTEWKRRQRGEPWYQGETVSVAIGQGAVDVTPLALATMMATVANGGTRITPHVVKAIDDGRGWQPVPPPAPRGSFEMAPEHLAAVRDGLWLAVNGAGTAGRARIAGRDVAGKTGTAQVISLTGAQLAATRGTSRDLRDHGWFVFFAPRDQPRIAGVVFGEHAERGSATAPIARFVLETFFAKEEGRPLPAWPDAAPGGAVPAREPDRPEAR